MSTEQQTSNQRISRERMLAIADDLDNHDKWGIPLGRYAREIRSFVTTDEPSGDRQFAGWLDRVSNEFIDIQQRPSKPGNWVPVYFAPSIAELERRTAEPPTDHMRQFIAAAVTQLREHRYCGDQYPDNGWPGINEALALYERATRGQLTKSSGPTEAEMKDFDKYIETVVEMHTKGSDETEERLSCMHKWTVLGAPRNPDPDQICEGGCGRTYAAVTAEHK